MRNILILAYALSPTRGSEYSVAWNYIKNMSKDNNLTVLYGTSGEHMGNCQEMEMYAHKQVIPNVRFIPVYPNQFARLLNWPNRHGFFVYSFYFAYQEWQRQAYKKAKELVSKERYDLIHFVGMIGYREPGYLWKLKLPYVWGPISGANNSPAALMGNMPTIGKIKHKIRTICNNIQIKYSYRLKQALAHTDILLTATSENQQIFKDIHDKDSLCIPENGLTDETSFDESKFKNLERINLIVVGRLDAAKAVNILIEALTQIRHTDRLHLDVVGGGPLLDRLRTYATDHGLEPLITWHGQLPRAKTIQMFKTAHLHVITSISEGNPTTIWEAMSYGVPTMSFDHCGMHDTLSNGAGILLPIAKTYNENVKRVADAIDNILEKPTYLYQLASATIQKADQYKWEKRRIFLNDLYGRLLSSKI